VTSDEVVLAVKRTSPAPWLEVHCHGGREVVRLLLETLAQRGVRVCSWQRLEEVSADNPLQALAAAALADAVTIRTAAILLDQYHGAFAQPVEAITAALDRQDPVRAGELLDELARYCSVGRHLTTPWRVVVAGAPNVGKSSLVNALAGYQRSVVAPTPGTTRDVVTTLAAVDGWPVELADTAGLREETGTLERQGMDLARSAIAAADLCLWVLDASTPPAFPSEDMRFLLGSKLRLVVNKIDLRPGWAVDQVKDAIRVSARTGTGLGELCQLMANALVPMPPPAGAAVPFTQALCEQIEKARGAWQEGKRDDTRALLPSLAPGSPRS
jgi:tRNA modification GTPase